MKVALLSFHFAEYAYRLASAIAAHQEVLLFLREDNVRAELGDTNLGNISCQVVSVPHVGPKAPMRLARTVSHVTRHIREFGPDIIHCQEYLASDYLVAVLILNRHVPMVLTIHDHLPHSGSDASATWRRRLYRPYLRRRCAAAIVHGECIRGELEAIEPALRGRVAAVPHSCLGMVDEGVDMESTWEPGYVLFFGRIERYKGLGYLLDAMDLLDGEGVPIRLIIAGRGSDLERHRSRINANPIVELVEGFIPREKVRDLMLKANVVVMPYTDATQSGVAAMAMGYGRPVVASDVGSVGEMVRDGETGLLVSPRDPRALATAIRRLVQDQAFALRCSRAALSLVEGELSWDATAEKTVGVYRRVLGNQIQ